MASHASAAIIAIMNTFWPSPARPALFALPVCHAKRSATFAEWVCDEVMEPIIQQVSCKRGLDKYLLQCEEEF